MSLHFAELDRSVTSMTSTLSIGSPYSDDPSTAYVTPMETPSNLNVSTATVDYFSVSVQQRNIPRNALRTPFLPDVSSPFATARASPPPLSDAFLSRRARHSEPNSFPTPAQMAAKQPLYSSQPLEPASEPDTLVDFSHSVVADLLRDAMFPCTDDEDCECHDFGVCECGHNTSKPPNVLLLDARSSSEFTLGHIRYAMQVVVPSTLLKRWTSAIEKVLGSPLMVAARSPPTSTSSSPDTSCLAFAVPTGSSPPTRESSNLTTTMTTTLHELVLRVRESTHIIVYGNAADRRAIAESNLVRLVRKILLFYSCEAALGWLEGGFEQFATLHPQLLDGWNTLRAAKSSLQLAPSTMNFGGLGIDLPQMQIVSPLFDSDVVSLVSPAPKDGEFIRSGHRGLPRNASGSSISSLASLSGTEFESSSELAKLEFFSETLSIVPPTGIPRFLVDLLHSKQNLVEIISGKFQELEMEEARRLEMSFRAQSEADEFSLSVGLEGGDRNRYKNIWPFNYNRVPLTTSTRGDYINASLVFNPMCGDHCMAPFQESSTYNPCTSYIATQRPLPSTGADFWRMCWEQDVSVIVMLSDSNEGGRIGFNYFPSSFDQPQAYFGSEYIVSLLSLHPTSDTSIHVRILNLQSATGTSESRRICHIQFSAWPDHGIPKSPDSILRLQHIVSSLRRGHAPVVVHCSAGCGRTGTFIALDSIISSGSADTLEHAEDVVFATVARLRMQRMRTVQTLSQFAFCYEVLLRRARKSDIETPGAEGMIMDEREDDGTVWIRRNAKATTDGLRSQWHQKTSAAFLAGVNRLHA
ncbi:protein-tyrosine phosphatase-like protein [Cladochytrium replicatum]|nr:protein-tyrosine phosphatase-like protein [Cladochytrium replicatum]